MTVSDVATIVYKNEITHIKNNKKLTLMIIIP
jgi:hypothetical protein